MTQFSRAAGGVAVLSALVLGLAPAAAADPPVDVPANGQVTATVRATGTGVGLSAYGAQGASTAGLIYPQILNFYYPHTALATLNQSWVRALLSRSVSGPTTTVRADTHLTVTGLPGELPTQGVRRYRLVADDQSHLILKQLTSARGATWRTYRTGLPNPASFHRSNFYSLRLFAPDGSSIRYRGSLRAYRNTGNGPAVGGLYTVNRVTLDRYTAGVLPHVVPSSLRRGALNAEAVAIRSRARNRVIQSTPTDRFDSLLDEYRGMTQYDEHGKVISAELVLPATETSNRVLLYNGRAISAESGLSNGGWTATGNAPYLVARKDPYDNAASGDPYLSPYSRTIDVKYLAEENDFRSISQLAITRRDGNGIWGGRVEELTATGIAGSTGEPKTAIISTPLPDIDSNWFTLSAP